MRIFYAFLVLLTSVFLWMLPVTDMVYDFCTTLRTDTFSATTPLASTTANVTLWGDLYDCDMGSIDIDSDNTTDTPVPSSANCTSRVLLVDGLSANTTRILTVAYDVDSLTGFPALKTLLDMAPFIWIVIILCFAPAAIFAIFTGRSG